MSLEKTEKQTIQNDIFITTKGAYGAWNRADQIIIDGDAAYKSARDDLVKIVIRKYLLVKLRERVPFFDSSKEQNRDLLDMSKGFLESAARALNRALSDYKKRPRNKGEKMQACV